MHVSFSKLPRLKRPFLTYSVLNLQNIFSVYSAAATVNYNKDMKDPVVVWDNALHLKGESQPLLVFCITPYKLAEIT